MTTETIQAPAPRTPLQEFWHYFSSNKGAVVGLIFIVLICFMAVFANFIAPHSPSDQARDALLLPPAWMEGGKTKTDTTSLGIWSCSASAPCQSTSNNTSWPAFKRASVFARGVP